MCGWELNKVALLLGHCCIDWLMNDSASTRWQCSYLGNFGFSTAGGSGDMMLIFIHVHRCNMSQPQIWVPWLHNTQINKWGEVLHWLLKRFECVSGNLIKSKVCLVTYWLDVWASFYLYCFNCNMNCNLRFLIKLWDKADSPIKRERGVRKARKGLNLITAELIPKRREWNLIVFLRKSLLRMLKVTTACSASVTKNKKEQTCRLLKKHQQDDLYVWNNVCKMISFN